VPDQKRSIKEIAGEVRRALEPYSLVKALGLDGKSKNQAHGVMVLCPWHQERNPDCSVTQGRGGGVRVRCHACQESTDGLGLIAKVHNLGMRGREFVQVVRIAAEIANLHSVLAEIDAPRAGGRSAPAPVRPPPPPVEALPPVSYPPTAELRELWDTCGPVLGDSEVCAWLDSRSIDSERCPGRVIGRQLSELDARRSGSVMGDVIASLAGRVSLCSTVLPRWAGWRGERPERLNWSQSGHRLLLPVFDCDGVWQSVRACRITDAFAPDSPKRLPPSGYSASGLVLANRPAVMLLRGKSTPHRVVIVEGEPDYLTWVTRAGEDTPIIGLFSGAWSKSFGARFPDGCEVALRVHADKAGERYVADVASTLRHCQLRLIA
jgi:hypothetical protein